MRPLKVKVSITLDEDTVEKIRELADKDDRNFSQYINVVLKAWIRNRHSGKDKNTE